MRSRLKDRGAVSLMDVDAGTQCQALVLFLAVHRTGIAASARRYLSRRPTPAARETVEAS
jgi:hypothetical protein